MQSDSNRSNDELPQDFTSRIINIIQNKQHERQEINLSSETEEEQMYPPEKQKQSCKKSGKRDQIQLGYRNGQGKGGGRSYKVRTSQGSKREEIIDKAFDAISEESSTLKKEGRGKAQEAKSQEIVESHQILKEYFQQFLTKVLKKMEDDTNKLLKQLIKKTDSLQERLQSFLSESKSKDPETDQDYIINEQKQKKHPYIKNWMKLNYVQRIQRKQMTAKQAAKQLKVKESVVQDWLANKKKNKLKASNKKQYKVNGSNERKKAHLELRSENQGDIEYDFLEDIE